MKASKKELEEFMAHSRAMVRKNLECDTHRPISYTDVFGEEKMNTVKEKDLLAYESFLIYAGYLRSEVYDHDQYTTYRYRKGQLQVELTFEGLEMVSSDIAIDEMIIQTDSEGIEEITRVLSKYMNQS